MTQSEMVTSLRVVTLALAGSSVLALLHVRATEDCTTGPWGMVNTTGAMLSIWGWWIALVSGLVLALVPQTRERDLVATTSIGACAFVMCCALLGMTVEFAVCALYESKEFVDFTIVSFRFLVVATPMALVWRAWRGE